MFKTYIGSFLRNRASLLQQIFFLDSQPKTVSNIGTVKSKNFHARAFFPENLVLVKMNYKYRNCILWRGNSVNSTDLFVPKIRHRVSRKPAQRRIFPKHRIVKMCKYEIMLFSSNIPKNVCRIFSVSKIGRMAMRTAYTPAFFSTVRLT